MSVWKPCLIFHKSFKMAGGKVNGLAYVPPIIPESYLFLVPLQSPFLDFLPTTGKYPKLYLPLSHNPLEVIQISTCPYLKIHPSRRNTFFLFC